MRPRLYFLSAGRG